VYKNLSFVFNDLIFCLFFVQINEGGQKQGKSRDPESFPPYLSTETVDSFALALRPASLQHGPGINGPERG
jgi:hypothetical protein